MHAGDVVAFAQSIHFRRDDPEVLGDDRQVPELVFDGVEYCVARTRLPGSDAGVRRIGGHRPVGLEAAEMIDAHEIGQLG